MRTCVKSIGEHLGHADAEQFGRRALDELAEHGLIRIVDMDGTKWKLQLANPAAIEPQPVACANWIFEEVGDPDLDRYVCEKIELAVADGRFPLAELDVILRSLDVFKDIDERPASWGRYFCKAIQTSVYECDVEWDGGT